MALSITGDAVAQPFAYISNKLSSDVYVLDTATNTIVNIIDLQFTSRAVAIPPSGDFVYVTDGDGVSIIDTATNSVVDTVPVFAPTALAVTPRGERVYVANVFEDTVTVIDTSTPANDVIATIDVGDGPSGLVVTPDGGFVYVSNMGGPTLSDSVSVIDTSTNTVIATVSVGDGPRHIAISPDGGFVYVSNFLDTESVSVIDTSTNTVVDTILVGGDPYAVAVNPNGKFWYVSTLFGSDGLHVYDTADNSLVEIIDIPGSGPVFRGISFSPDGKFLYGTQGTIDEVRVIDTSTNSIIESVDVGNCPQSMGVFIAQGPVNNSWFNRISVDGFSFQVEGANDLTTTQPLEQQLGNTGATVWWSWEAPGSGTVSFDTFGSNFDTQLHIFTGAENGFANLIPVANNNNAAGGTQSEVTFEVEIGQTYEIRVGGFQDGNFLPKAISF